MGKIIIDIQQGLTPEEEIIAISKKLAKKSISNTKNVKAIGDGLLVEDLQTQIIVNRIYKEKVIVTARCSVCGCVYEKSKSKKLVTNYGGTKKILHYCSEDCRLTVLDMFGGRVAKSKLKPLIKHR
jgi:rubredoxin